MEYNANIDSAEATELNQMREQLRQLRDRLDSQVIVSETLLRYVIKRSTHFSRNYFKIESLVFFPLGVLSWIYLTYTMGIPLWYTVASILLMAASLLSDMYIQQIARMDYGQTPLLEMARRLTRQKRLRARRMLWGMIILGIWLLTFVYILVYRLAPEGMSPEEFSGLRMGMFCGAAVGLVIGLWIGVGSYLKMQHENTRSIDSLHSFIDTARD